jgi:UDP-N-acetylglucosamine--N-acetylmuramyl-(pentapeptide) pyrophosphoryl-undecaprenol N-acetylglucosamine transferase
MSNKLKMVISGGGTGGHYFPAKAIQKALQNKGVEVKYIGSRFGVEATLFPVKSNDILLLNIRGVQRQMNLGSIIKNILFPFRVLISYYQSRKFLSSFQPHVVIGTGGYASGLPLLAAIHKGIKTVIQEQNSYPGITTRYLLNRVNKICIAYEEVGIHLKKKILFLLGIQFEKIFK